MTLTKRLLIRFIILYTLASIGVIIYSYYSIKAETFEKLTNQYAEHFRVAEEDLNTFFSDIEQDLVTMASNPVVQNRNDSQFTSFLDADKRAFKYNYTQDELKIVRLFSDYSKMHPFVNSIYMGRANGTFVRSHPRIKATQYDPRKRPWYELAMNNPNKVMRTEAYSSVTTQDVNIGTVVALLDEIGTAYGVLGMDVTLVDLSRKLSKMQLYLEGKLELWDTRDFVIISPWIEKLNKPQLNKDGYKKVYTGNNIILEKNETYFKMMQPVKIIEGQLVAYVPVYKVNKVIWQTILNRVVFATIFLFLMAMATFILFERMILKPIRGMNEALKQSNSIGKPVKMDIKASGELAVFQNEYNQLIHKIELDEAELNKIKLLIISSLASMAEMRDYETGLHIVRTQKYFELLAMAYNEIHQKPPIQENKIVTMIECAPLHDIGKVAIPDKILLKPGPLTADEFQIMKQHTVYGKEAIQKGNVDIRDQLFIETAINIVYYHHERWDGTGYPEGLSGEAIPLEARIMSLADVYDALTTKRIYKNAITHEAALQILLNGKGTQFDPLLIEAFQRVEKNFKIIAELYCEN